MRGRDPLAWELPTATHIVVLAQDTSYRPRSPAPGLGLGTIDQRVPSHRSTSVLVAEAVKELPTAMQNVVLAQDTPVRLLWPEPALGLGTIDQRVPSHCSTSVLVAVPVK